MTFLQPDQTRRPSGSFDPANQGHTPEPADVVALGEPDRSDLKRWLTPLAVVLAIVLVAGIAGVAIWRSLPAPHLTIEVFNDTGAPIKDVRLMLAGRQGVRSSETLASGTTLAWEMTGQSDGFTLQYREPDGRVVTRQCALALDGDDWGTLTLHVKRGGLKVLTEVDAPGAGSAR